MSWRPELTAAWLRRIAPVEQPWARLVCLPHAGGTASFFRPWKREMPPDVDLYAVQYPGRLDRLGEPCIDDMDVLAEAVADAVAPLADRPVALFGHSLGGLVAFEVAQRLPARTGRPVLRLFVSGSPGLSCLRPGTAYLDSDEVLWADVLRLNGTSSQVVHDAELRRAVLPALRSDYRLAGLYRPPVTARVDCPVTALLGDADPEVTLAEARAWARSSPAGFSVRLFPGDHFYLVPRCAEVVAEVVRQMAETSPDRRVGDAGP